MDVTDAAASVEDWDSLKYTVTLRKKPLEADGRASAGQVVKSLEVATG
ncbi:hypothetical protein RvY_05138 [Ramazzottius varieornatus]|uniref:Uncharacterized protein n=1 Tax=Ramazzottius varieornatus TaxID=947166 RepID=A0A1D1UXK7_RAMVA|nr:hypothetical protein RvY_05138 [Ramazzottius varieornatus]